jgi:hypothetical protein
MNYFILCKRQRAILSSVSVVTLAIVAGCHCTPPPRYHTAWRRVTSAQFQPAHPYCHGYTHTQWSRWPDECNQHEFIITEEVPLPPPVTTPVPLPRTSPPEELFDSPLLPSTPAVPDDVRPTESSPPDRLIVPQNYSPSLGPTGGKLFSPPSSQRSTVTIARRSTTGTATATKGGNRKALRRNK